MALLLTKENFTAKLDPVTGAKLYHDLKQAVEEKQILKRRYGYYTFIWILTFSTTLLAGYFLLKASSYWEFVAWNFVFAFFLSHFGGLMHDAAHQAITKHPITNEILGTIASGVLTMNYNAWKIKHNIHHAHPNTYHKDLDLELPVLAFTKERYNSAKGLSAKLHGIQAWLFYPMTSLQGYSFQFKNNGSYLYRQWKKGFSLYTLMETVIFLAGVAFWYVLPFYLLSLDRAVTFIFITPMFSGLYLANIFAPNHKGMPELDENLPISFLEQQIITSRNISQNPWIDFVYFGLNYQIEHHLFPNCPRVNLKKIVSLVKELCEKNGLPYTKVSVLESQRIIISELHKVSKNT